MATKYVSSLTGPEMDAALIDMAYHNSEAYAVGTRNGVPVGSSDVTYHNNSKYWAEQVYGYTDRAEDAANRAEAAVPSGTAGAVFFDREQTLTSAQQSQARANIMAGGSNRNLLDNPWFTVRQRGDGPFSGAVYTVDRWTKFYNGIITGTDNGVSITPSGTSGWIEFAQYLPADVGAALEGKTLTLSALLQDGTLYSKSGVCVAKPSSGTTNFITISMPNSMGFVVGRRNDGALRVEFTYGQAYSQDPLNVRAVKLELGSVSTLANDAPPDYGEELLKCQRYFTRWYSTAGSSAIGLALAVGTTNANFALLSNLRAEGSATVSFTGLVLSDGTDKTVTNVSVAGAGDGKSMRLLVTSSGLTAYRPYVLQITAGGHLDVSKDL